MQVLIGPRQTGKSTLARQLRDSLNLPTHMASADAVGTAHSSWIQQNWETARSLAKGSQGGALLVLDEIQKIPQWSEHVKKLWDEETELTQPLRVLLLGSSPLLMNKGLTESLAGRFEIIPVTHWSFSEMQNAFQYSLEQYVVFGGYPGAAEFITDNDRWSRYILDSLVETTISRDIFLMSRIDKPALFRQLFELGCQHSGHILSYQKMLGQLQDAGNSTTLAGYLKLLEGAGLVCGLQKFGSDVVRKKASSPKLQVFNNALLTAWNVRSPADWKQDTEVWGQLVESAVGAHLVNQARLIRAEIFYWNDGSKEVDFVIPFRDKIIAIEVKSGRRSRKISGLTEFLKFNPRAKPLLVGTGGMPLEEFFTRSIDQLF
ncbi:MAG: hypothetical protein RL189_1669 [Pseudomonadota bacterium]